MVSKIIYIWNKILLYGKVWLKAFLSNKIENVFEVDINELESKKRIAVCIGFGDWKRKYFREYIKEYYAVFIDHRVPAFRLINILKNFTKDYEVFIWSYKEPQKVLNFFKEENKKITRIEDGFIRSVGLGVDETKPLSLIFDKQELYFNSHGSSGLENIILTQVCNYTDRQLNYARSVMNMIVENKITKYNYSNNNSADSRCSQANKKTILVVGQVEDDMSIIMGSDELYTNLDLLQKAKEENPDDYIVFKPHPDILSGKRVNSENIKSYKYYSDFIAYDQSIIDCILVANHVYTITSLSGFEALIRGKKVTCFGSPFYAHWGLTDDRATVPERRKNIKVTLDSLFYAAYIEYPVYLLGNIENTVRKIMKEKGKEDAKSI